MKQIHVSKLKRLNPWLDDLTPESRKQVEEELARQRRALKSVIDGHMARRTARRIIERSKRRINWIIAEEMVKK